MDIKIIPVDRVQQSVLRQLMELYDYDFSEFTKEDVNEHGLYGYGYLDRYWAEETRHPFFIMVDGNYAGFVLVSKFHGCRYTKNENAHSIDEFFVMRKYRRMNVGNFAAKYVFDLFKGEWEVRVLHENKPALPFWNKTINEYTNGDNTFHTQPNPKWDGIGYTFNSK